MGLETTTTIAGLVATNPVSGDPLGQADDHLRLIKSVIKTIFPGTSGSGFSIPITATEAELNYVHGVTSAIQTQLNTISGTAATALANAATADGKAVTADGKAVTADGKAVSAQSTANTALANAATADSKAVVAQAMGADSWGRINGATGAFVKGYNVASSSRVSLGNYTVTFSNAMPNADYAALVSCSSSGHASWNSTVGSDATKIRILTYDTTGALFDPDFVSVAIFAVP